MSVSHSIFGRIFENGNALDAFASTRNGFGKGLEFHTFNLAFNVLALHYSRLTSTELTFNWKNLLDAASTNLAGILRTFTQVGYVTAFDDSRPSIWLTAWVLKYLKIATFQEWEFGLHIDENVRQPIVYLY